MLGQFKQTSKTALVHDETVLDVKMEPSFEEKRPVSMTGLAVGMNRPLMGGLSEHVRGAPELKRNIVQRSLLDQPRKPTLIAARRHHNVWIHGHESILKGHEHGRHGPKILTLKRDRERD